MDLLSELNVLEGALIEDVLKKYLGSNPRPEDYTKCEINDHDPYNKILSYNRKKLGVIKVIFSTEENFEYGLKFLPVENWLQ